MDTNAIRVLLIEDDPEDVDLIKLFLGERVGAEPCFEIETEDRLSSGCKRLARDAAGFDAALLDLVLPCAEGIEAFLKVRETSPGLPVVVLTGIRDEALALEAVRMGAQDYLVKGTIDGRLLKRALRHSIERHRLLAKVEYLLAKDLDGKVVVDAEGLVRYANPAAESLFGRKTKELLGKPFAHSLPEREGAGSEVSLGSEPGRVAEIRVADIEWNGAPGKLATIRDVTELRRVEQLKAEIKERMLVVDLKNEFMTTISHELRNPLTTVKTALQSLKEGLVGPMSQQQARFVELAYRNTERQVKIINNILDLARFQSGKAKLELRKTALPQLIEERAQSYAIAPKGPRLSFEIGEDLSEVTADPDLVTQVLSNLIDNALRFARERVVVKAEPGEGDGTVVLTVADDGPGMSQAQMAKLFTKFVQVSRTGNSSYKGTGLGLAICKEIVAAHGGRIWVESAPGKGARFRFTLPAAAVPSHAV